MILAKKKLVIAIAAFTPFAVIAADDQAQNKILPTIVVSASLAEESPDTAPASITVVTGEQIQQSSATSLAEVLGKTVGVQNYNGGGREKLTIRGVRESNGIYTLILVNGKRISSTGALWRDADLDISSIPLSGIERVEVIRGPMSALYGSDAIGGVINIITKKPTKDWHGAVNADYHLVDRGDGKQQYRIGASASGALTDQLGLSISAEQYDRDAWFSQGKATNPAYYIEAKKTQNLRSTLSYELNDQQNIDLDLGYNKDERPLGIDTYRTGYDPQFGAWVNKGSSSQEIERYTVGLTHKGNWSWGNTTVSAQQENSKINDYDSDFDQPQHRTLKENNTNLRAYSNFDLGINGVVAGIEYNNQEVKDPVTYRNTGKASVSTTSLFLQDDIHITDPLTLSLSGRYDDHEVFGSHFSPKVYLVYQLPYDVVIKGGYGQAFKAPSLAQMTKDYGIVSCGSKCTLWGNPNLKPETSDNFEISASIRKSTWNGSVTLFQNKIDDMISRNITWNANGDPIAAAWVNLNSVKIKGIELAGQADLLPMLSVDANATYLDAKNSETNKRLDERPRLQANTNINFKPLDWLTLTAGASHMGNQVINNKQLPNYTLVNLGLSAKIDSAVTLRTGIRNLTDVDLEEKGKAVNLSFNEKELGRNYYVGLTYTF
ncbi:MAG: TonB-dependent receptor [Acinetobacter sp.]